jgi:SAM-dependent methyltransferase
MALRVSQVAPIFRRIAGELSMTERNRAQIYDRIGVGYARHRRADPRLVDAIQAQLNLPDGSTIADIGAGSGNYSRALAERGFSVKAVEPSQVMREQALTHPRVEWLPGVAEAIPLPNRSVAGVVSVLIFHHLRSSRQAVLEMARIAAGPVVLLTFDPRLEQRLWVRDYFPEVFAADTAVFPPIAEVEDLFNNAGLAAASSVFMVPHDMRDMFLAAPWRRPQLYLDPEIRAGMSIFAFADQRAVDTGVARLRADLESGVWRQRYAGLLDLDGIDAGYRLVAARPKGSLR